MRHYNEQAELPARRNMQPTHSSAKRPRRALLHRPLRAAALICLALLMFHGLALWGLGESSKAKKKTSLKEPSGHNTQPEQPQATQPTTNPPNGKPNQPPLAPKVVSVDVTKPSGELLQYRFSGSGPQAETELNFRSDGQRWRFIYFDELPENTSLRVKGAPAGYEDSEPLQLKRWYPFKTLLPVILDIKPEARMPVEVGFFSGVANTRDDEAQLRTLDPKDVRTFIANHGAQSLPPDKRSLIFTWDAPAVGTTPSSSPLSSPSPLVSQSTQTTTPQSNTWWKYLTEEEPLAGIVVLILILALIAVLALVVMPKLVRQIRSRRRRRRKQLRNQKRVDQSPLEGLGTNTNSSTSQETRPPAQKANKAERTQLVGAVIYRDDKLTLSDQKLSTQNVNENQPQPRDQTESASQPYTPAPSPAAQDGISRARLDDIESTVSKLGLRVADLKGLLTKTDVDNMLRASQQGLLAEVQGLIDRRVGEAVRPVEELMTEQTSSLLKRVDETAKRVSQVDEEEVEIKKQLTELLTELRKAEQRLREQFEALQMTLDRPSVQDSFYAKTLGAVLGQNVEALQPENFKELSRQVGERLEEFFRADVSRGEGLQQVRSRAEAVLTALGQLVSQIAKSNSAAADEAGQYVRRVEGFVAELSRLQGQLQNRRASIETTISVPVSLHAGARQGFLDELGRGIKREIDKLAEPESYFEGKLEHLVTADVIAVVDICDKKVAPPGTRAELDAPLKQLFEATGLRPILPRQGEPFKTAEQDLIEMVQGGPSLTVARVITRGFYYKHQDNETLLRKAGVTIYK